MVDEVTDISVQSQMLTFIQFVSPVTSSVEIAFLSVQNVLDEFSSANANALTSLTVWFKSSKSKRPCNRWGCSDDWQK